MSSAYVRKAAVLLGLILLLAAACQKSQPPAPKPQGTELAVAPGCGPVTLTIDAKSATPPWIPPPDIPGGAGSANLQSAALFAWQEFIALNWPAVAQNGAVNTRDQPDPNALFGDPKYSGAQAAGPLVWHTFRHKSEIFPGTVPLPSPSQSPTPPTNPPHGYVNDPNKYYGYDDAPQYVYTPNPTASPSQNIWFIQANGQIPPFSGTASTTTPWINLDEQSEIGLDAMFAGIAPTNPFPGQQILFMAKANRAEYTYIAANQWWVAQNGSAGPPLSQTTAYIAGFAQNPQAYAEPTPGSTNVVSFPNNTIEVKSGWRQLTPQEASSGRFYTTTVRYYNAPVAGTSGSTAAVGYVDAVWGLVALHIIQKTPSAPYFIYATFSQADNLLDQNGKPIEDVNGNLLLNQGAEPLNPNVVSKNATPANPPTPQSIQQLSPLTSPIQPGQQGSALYYVNTPTTLPPASPTPTPTPSPIPTPPTTQGIVALNRREHNIPQCIIDVNTAAHAAIAAYSQQNNIQNSVWQYYKLINVQYQPYDKPAGTTYTGAPGGPDPSTYYQANEVVETDYNLQVFSGHFQNQLAQYPLANAQKLITDYYPLLGLPNPPPDGTPFRNVFYSNSASPGSGKAANMGGCMGCHGNAQVFGADFSFILLEGPVTAPDVAIGSAATAGASAQGIAKFNKLLLRK